MDSKVNENNYIAIQGWMVKDLGLKGNKLLIYAIIYGFSQTEGQVFNGSLQYLADWTNSTKQGVIQNLKELIQLGYIGKNEKILNGVKFCEYYSTKFNGVLNKVEWGIKESLMGGIKQSLPNNIDINNINNNIEDNIDNKKQHLQDKHSEVINIYNTYCVNLPQIQKLTDKRKTAINKLLKEFNVEQFKEICINANVSDFLTGNNDRGWKADFDFIIRPDKAVKILEGQYNNKKRTKMSVFQEMWNEEVSKNDQAGNNTSHLFIGE